MTLTNNVELGGKSNPHELANFSGQTSNLNSERQLPELTNTWPKKRPLTVAHPPCVKVLFESASGLDRYSAHSDISSLISASVVLDFYFRNAVHRGYCCSGWAVPLY